MRAFALADVGKDAASVGGVFLGTVLDTRMKMSVVEVQAAAYADGVADVYSAEGEARFRIASPGIRGTYPPTASYLGRIRDACVIENVRGGKETGHVTFVRSEGARTYRGARELKL